MEKLMILIVFSLFVFCSDDPNYGKSDEEIFFGGNHPLLSLNKFVKTTSKDSVLVLVTKNSNGKTIQFCWKNSKGEELFTTLSFDQVRFKSITSSDSLNYGCKFRWRQNNDSKAFSLLWNSCIVYAVVSVDTSQILVDSTFSLNR